MSELLMDPSFRWGDGHASFGSPRSPCPNAATIRTMPDLPIACTLDASTLSERSDVLLPGLAGRAGDVCWRDNGVRLTFRSDVELLEEITRVIAAEHRCCQFLRFELVVEPGDGPVTLDVTGPVGTVEFLESLLKAES